ncbi:MAG: PKD domain-containing protein [Flavobacteriales bacterium]|nr:PKD domain-containing protein [Flavobacteriales bacterium]
MLRYLNRTLLPLLLTLSGTFMSRDAAATHIAGGEIYWDCLGGNQYRITLVIYRDCFGINLNTSYVLNLTSPCGNQTLTVTTAGGVEISQLCQPEIGNSTCNGGTLPGIQQYVYTGIATLPPCDYWTISWQANYRNAAIQNLVNPGASPTYIQATLNNLAAGCEDSPQFTNIAIPYVCAGYPINYSYGVFDNEGDSLVYSLVTAMGNGGVPVTYQPPYTPTLPIPGLTLDPLTGQLSFTLNVAGNWVVVVQVDIYQNGVHIGTVMREMQFIAYPCTNAPPDPNTGTIQNPTGPNAVLGPYALQVCESGAFCFDVVISDPNLSDVLTATTNVQQNLPGATFTYTGTNPITGTVCWTAAPGTSGFFPFIITVSDGACPIQAFQTYVYSIQVLPGLHVDIVTTDESCLGVGDGTATVNVLVGTAPYTFLWNTGDTTNSITGTAGNYSVLANDANGCSNLTYPVTINAMMLPSTAIAGADVVVCPGTDTVQLQGVAVNSTGFNWSGGTGSFIGSGLNPQYLASPGELANGGVDLYLTTLGDPACTPDVDTVHVSLSTSFDNAVLTAGPISCHGVQDGSVGFSPVNSTFNYVWNIPGQSGPLLTGLGPGFYAITVSDTLGCDTTMTVVLQQPAPLVVDLVATVPVTCPNGSDGSITVTASGGTLPYSINWPNGQTGMSATGLQGGIHMFVVTDAHGCTVNGATNLQAPMPIGLVAQVPDTVCVNAPVMLTAQGSGGQGGYVFTWGGVTTGDTVTFSFPFSQMVSVSVTDMAGCPGPTVQVPIYVLDLSTATLSAWSDTTVCVGAKVEVGAALLGYPGAYEIVWPSMGITGPGPHSVDVWGNMVIPVSAIDACGNNISTMITINAEQAPVVTLPPFIAEGCAPLDVTITSPVTGPGYTYLWNLGNGTTSTSPTAQVTYGPGTFAVSLTVTSAIGCSGTSPTTGMVTAHPGPNAAFTANTWVTNTNAPDIQFTNGSTGSITSYAWTFGNGGASNAVDPATTYAAVGTYPVTLVVTDANGCIDEATGYITVTPVYDVVMPNAFTPDPNGSSGGMFDPWALNNDVFYPFVKDADEVRMWIFNRWGELIFESDDMRVGWDGYYRGQLSPQDVYVYKLKVRFVDNTVIERTGDLTLIR